ncbi:BA14K family protein [Breoghania sp.]|uniref:BA14K family protein n=1 Tax=Breoghania sp. TaxID=2065378 RepID=UPI002AA90683|nr:BA14K family protein [Breoghania sp.]
MSAIAAGIRSRRKDDFRPSHPTIQMEKGMQMGKLRRLIGPLAIVAALFVGGTASAAIPQDKSPRNLTPTISTVRLDMTQFGLRMPERNAQGASIQLAQWGPPPPRWRRPPPRRYRRPPPRYGWGYRRPPPPRGYRRGGRAHVNWCLRRYRSYNPRTDRYLGYDGRYHRCRSPYR